MKALSRCSGGYLVGGGGWAGGRRGGFFFSFLPRGRAQMPTHEPVKKAQIETVEEGVVQLGPLGRRATSAAR
jgi:hypothetical protein